MKLSVHFLGHALLGILALHQRPPFTLAYDCTIAPISWKLQNATFKNNEAVNCGIKAQLPGDQIVGLRPSFSVNTTRLRNMADCWYNHASASKFISCQGASGSLFNPEDPGFGQLIDSLWSNEVEMVDLPPLAPRLEKGLVLAQFDGGPSIELPLEVWSYPDLESTRGTPNRSVLALGLKSSVLERLVDLEYIPSRVVELFFGSKSVERPTDGEIIPGGYDASRMAGPLKNYSIAAFPMNVSCPLRVRVTSVTLTNSKGSFEILIPGQVVSACVDGVQNAVTLPDDLYARWATLTNHAQFIDGQQVDSQTYLAENEHLMGTLTIGLDHGYKLTIPHYELVGPSRGADLNDQGQYAVLNSSRIQSAVSSGITDLGVDFGILLGGTFLSGSYLLVNYEDNAFGLANADLDTQNSTITTVCSLNTTVSSLGPSTTTSSATTATASSSAPSAMASSSAPSTTASSHPTGGGGGLSDNDKIGITAGVITTVLAAVGVYYNRRGSIHKDNPRQSQEYMMANMHLQQTTTESTNTTEQDEEGQLAAATRSDSYSTDSDG